MQHCMTLCMRPPEAADTVQRFNAPPRPHTYRYTHRSPAQDMCNACTTWQAHVAQAVTLASCVSAHTRRCANGVQRAAMPPCRRTTVPQCRRAVVPSHRRVAVPRAFEPPSALLSRRAVECHCAKERPCHRAAEPQPRCRAVAAERAAQPPSRGVSLRQGATVPPSRRAAATSPSRARRVALHGRVILPPCRALPPCRRAAVPTLYRRASCRRPERL
jgi:hypothetical protein